MHPEPSAAQGVLDALVLHLLQQGTTMATSHILQRPTPLPHRRFMRLTLGLVLVLVGCATPPTVRGTQWQLQGGAVDVDFEQSTAQQAEQLRQRGVQLPQGSHGLADLRAHRDFVEQRVTAVGFGLSAGGYRRYVRAHLPGGRTVPICLELANQRELGSTLEEGSKPGAPVASKVSGTVAVERWR